MVWGWQLYCVSGVAVGGILCEWCGWEVYYVNDVGWELYYVNCELEVILYEWCGREL